MRFLSLFSGCLGLDLGLERCGMESVAFVENDPACQAVIRARRPGVPLVGDVREVDEGHGLGVVDGLAAGFPCQPFSHAGRREGALDDRYLWPETIRCVRAVRPRLVVLENVPGLGTIRFDSGEPVFGRVLADLAEAGYVGSWFRLRAADVGAPHLRERIFILACDADAVGRGWWADDEGVVAAGGDGAAEAAVGAFADAERGAQRRARPGAVSGAAGAGASEGAERERVRADAGDGGGVVADAGGARRREVAGGAQADEGEPGGWPADEDHVAGGAGARGFRAAGVAASADAGCVAGEEAGERHGRPGAGGVAAARGGAGEAEPDVAGGVGEGRVAASADADDAGRGEHGGPVATRAELGAVERDRGEAAAAPRGLTSFCAGGPGGHSACRGGYREHGDGVYVVCPCECHQAAADAADAGRRERERAGVPPLRGAGGQSDFARGGEEGHRDDEARDAAADAAGGRLDRGQGEPEPGDFGDEEAAERREAVGVAADGGRLDADWGAYGPAVGRWEFVLGRAAPRPTDDRGRLNPRFVEWMLGFPDGWVDVSGVKRTQQLRMLGNSVQVQVGALAGLLLLELFGETP